MNPVIDQVGVTEGQALLAQLSDAYYAILSSARLEQEVGHDALCIFHVPGVGERMTSAPTTYGAIYSALTELSSLLMTPYSSHSPRNAPAIGMYAEGAGARISSTPDRFQSKTRQLTVGVTIPTILKRHLTSLANEQRTSFADVSRRLVLTGFEDFDEKSFSESSQSLFSMLASELRHWSHSDSEQVMLRLEPNQAIRLRARAKEYSRSASEFGAMCLAHGLALQQEQQLKAVEQKITSYRGAAIRPLASKLGLSSYAALLSGVLAGTIRAPKIVLSKLSEIFEAPETVLTEFFRRSFESRVVPAFKAEGGKPLVTNTATSWEDAVKSMNLSSDQTKELLDLDA